MDWSCSNKMDRDYVTALVYCHPRKSAKLSENIRKLHLVYHWGNVLTRGLMADQQRYRNIIFLLATVVTETSNKAGLYAALVFVICCYQSENHNLKYRHWWHLMPFWYFSALVLKFTSRRAPEAVRQRLEISNQAKIFPTLGHLALKLWRRTSALRLANGTFVVHSGYRTTDPLCCEVIFQSGFWKKNWEFNWTSGKISSTVVSVHFPDHFQRRISTSWMVLFFKMINVLYSMWDTSQSDWVLLPGIPNGVSGFLTLRTAFMFKKPRAKSLERHEGVVEVKRSRISHHTTRIIWRICGRVLTEGLCSNCTGLVVKRS